MKSRGLYGPLGNLPWPRICPKCGIGTALLNCPNCMCLDWTEPNPSLLGEEAVSETIDDVLREMRFYGSTEGLGTQTLTYADRIEAALQREREAHVKIVTRCPSCGRQSLFIGEGGHLTCSVIGCKQPIVEAAFEHLEAKNKRLREAMLEGESGLRDMEYGYDLPDHSGRGMPWREAAGTLAARLRAAVEEK